MTEHEKCVHCDCPNADHGQAERDGQIIDACALCRMTEEDWRKFMETVE